MDICKVERCILKIYHKIYGNYYFTTIRAFNKI